MYIEDTVQIIKMPINKLKLLENNPRKIDKQQFEKLCNNITKDPGYFTNRPCLVNHMADANEMIVYAGNQRLRAAKKLGWKEVPCIIDINLSEEMMNDRVILDNLHHGENDDDMLANLFDPARLLDLGFKESYFNGWEEEETKTEKKKKVKNCPNCGHEL